MLGPTFFQKKKLPYSKQKHKNIHSKPTLKDLYRSTGIRYDSPRFTNFLQSKSINSQRNSVKKDKNKNVSRQKLNIHTSSQRYSNASLKMTNSMFMTCNNTPRKMLKKAIKNTRDRFKFIYQIGFGGFGKVWKIEDKQEKKFYAMKQICKRKVLNKNSVESVMNQRKILSIIDHPFLINMRQSFQDQHNLYLLMDYLRGADLRYHICYKVNFTEQQTKFIIACIVLALEYVHGSNIIHRDIKPENIVFQQNGYARITDFGIAKVQSHKNVLNQQTSGTPGYMAPEILCKQDYSFTSDFFAIGVMTYQMMLNHRPYQGKNRQQIRQKILQKQVYITSEQIPKNWSLQAGDFINRLIKRNPHQRLGNCGIHQLKQHKWMQSIKWAKLQKKKITPPYIPNNICQTRDYLQQIVLYNQLNQQNLENDIPIRPTDNMQFQKYDYKKQKHINKKKQTNLKKIRRVSQQKLFH